MLAKQNYYNPVRIVCESLDLINQYIEGQSVLVITSPGFTRRNVVERIKRSLYPRIVRVWDNVSPNPDLVHLDEATNQLNLIKFDCVVALGGGSTIDSAKVLATTLANVNSPSIIDVFRNKKPSNWKSRLPLVVVPTTSGTGSEVTPFATVWDHIKQEKYSLSGDFVFPDVALLDPTLTLSLNHENTLYPALDSISHGLESIWNRNCSSISRVFALRALELSLNALPRVLIDPQDIDARQELQLASTYSGVAISQTRTAIAHAISYPLTSNLNIPHGLACSFTLPYLINKYIKSGVKLSNEDIETLCAVREMILGFDLSGEINKFTNQGEVVCLIEASKMNDRVQNYSCALDFSLRDLLINSVY